MTLPRIWAAGLRWRTCAGALGSAASVSLRIWSPIIWASTFKVGDRASRIGSVPALFSLSRIRLTPEDLSDDPRVGVYLEDHYYDKTDAAVVFQRRDHQTGDVRYVYHGNDGTSFLERYGPARLPESRGARGCHQTILHVARNFPVIRFDAAMTLAKKHIQRLWFPEPGSGGAIRPAPSTA